MVKELDNSLDNDSVIKSMCSQIGVEMSSSTRIKTRRIPHKRDDMPAWLMVTVSEPTVEIIVSEQAQRASDLMVKELDNSLDDESVIKSICSQIGVEMSSSTSIKTRRLPHKRADMPAWLMVTVNEPIVEIIFAREQAQRASILMVKELDNSLDNDSVIKSMCSQIGVEMSSSTRIKTRRIPHKRADMPAWLMVTVKQAQRASILMVKGLDNSLDNDSVIKSMCSQIGVEISSSTRIKTRRIPHKRADMPAWLMITVSEPTVEIMIKTRRLPDKRADMPAWLMVNVNEPNVEIMFAKVQIYLSTREISSQVQPWNISTSEINSSITSSPQALKGREHCACFFITFRFLGLR
ncbi:hypothetical protein GJ496_003361 [Pomphorhynchus laevis]|nr:hypothetical protein GJ496_003361 [Pomphorhynchus laevis]